MPELSSRELATVLHALRIYQSGIIEESAACDHFAEEEPLTDAEVDALCERLNAGSDDDDDLEDVESPLDVNEPDDEIDNEIGNARKWVLLEVDSNPFDVRVAQIADRRPR